MNSKTNLRIYVANRLIDFFQAAYPSIHTPITPATNVVSLYRLGAEQWGLLADRISKQKWMIELHSRLKPGDMARASTIAQLTTLVIASIKHAVTQIALAPAVMTFRSQSYPFLQAAALSRPRVQRRFLAKKRG